MLQPRTRPEANISNPFKPTCLLTFGPHTQIEAKLSSVDTFHRFTNLANKFIVDILHRFITRAKGFNDNDLLAFANPCKLIQS